MARREKGETGAGTPLLPVRENFRLGWTWGNVAELDLTHLLRSKVASWTAALGRAVKHRQGSLGASTPGTGALRATCFSICPPFIETSSSASRMVTCGQLTWRSLVRAQILEEWGWGRA